jgi:hypothetical protein
MQALADPTTALPRNDLTHAHIGNLLRAFEAAYQGARRDGAL